MALVITLNKKFDNINTIKLIITFNIELPIVSFNNLDYPNTINDYKNNSNFNKIINFNMIYNKIILTDTIDNTCYYYLINKNNINDIYKLSPYILSVLDKQFITALYNEYIKNENIAFQIFLDTIDMSITINMDRINIYRYYENNISHP
jgi:hypothetical protein